MSKQSVTEERLQRLIDEDDIKHVIYRHGVCLDHKRWEEWADLFAEDATFVAPFVTHHGREGLAEMAEGALKPFLTHHNMVQRCIEFPTEDTAECIQSGIAFHTKSKEDLSDTFGEGGYNILKFVRTADGWKIKYLEEDLRWSIGEDTTGLS